ncbi:MAG TPA: OmpA family protein, partial [Polyangia bacterium]
MNQLMTIALAAFAFAAPDANTFELRESGTAAKTAQGATASKIAPTKTEAAMKFFVIDKDKGQVQGVVVCLAAADGPRHCTEETDAAGYAEVLVPNGKKYEVTYLSLGRKDIAASVTVTEEPKQSIKLTLRYKALPPPPPFVLSGITFDTNKAIIRRDSATQLDVVYEFMRQRKSAHIEIAGHTDNVGKPKANKTLSTKRAEACRAYLIAKGIDGSRITAVGFGGDRPVVP